MRVGGAIVMVLAAAACTTVNVDPVPTNGGSGALPAAGSGGSGGSGGSSGSGGGGAGGSTTARAGSGGTGSGSAGGTSPIIGSGANGGSGSDGNDGDAGLGELGDGAAVAGNLISNPGFELGLTAWTAKFGGTLARTTDEAYAGEYSAKLSGRTAIYQGVFYNMTGLVTSGTSYTAIAHAYTTDGTATTANLKLTALLSCAGEIDSRYVTVRSLTSSTTAWSELSGSFPIPASGACSLNEAFLYVEGPPGNFDLYVDDVSLVAN